MKSLLWSRAPWFFFGGAIFSFGTVLSCSKAAVKPKPTPSRPSDIRVEVRDGGPDSSVRILAGESAEGRKEVDAR